MDGAATAILLLRNESENKMDILMTVKLNFHSSSRLPNDFFMKEKKSTEFVKVIVFFPLALTNLI